MIITKSRKSLTIILIAAIALVILIVAVTLIDFFTHLVHSRMYTNLDQFSKLDEYVVEDLPIERLAETKALSGRYCKLVRWEEHEYTVYAYLFEKAEDAEDYYYARISKGKKPQSTTAGFKCWSNYFFTTHCVAWYGTGVYAISGGGYHNTSAFLNWLTEDFPVELLPIIQNEMA